MVGKCGDRLIRRAETRKRTARNFAALQFFIGRKAPIFNPKAEEWHRSCFRKIIICPARAFFSFEYRQEGEQRKNLTIFHLKGKKSPLSETLISLGTWSTLCQFQIAKIAPAKISDPRRKSSFQGERSWGGGRSSRGYLKDKLATFRSFQFKLSFSNIRTDYVH